MLQRFNMLEAKPVGSTLPANCRLSGKEGPKRKAEKEDMMKVPYASAVGSLMYAMVCTRPDIGYAVGVVSRFMSNPGKEHWNAVKWWRFLDGFRVLAEFVTSLRGIGRIDLFRYDLVFGHYPSRRRTFVLPMCWS